MINTKTCHQRDKLDVKDTLDLINYLRVRDPFVNNTSLFNIANGMSAHEGVTADNPRDIGEIILSSMIGESVDKFKFRKCNQAMNLNSMSVVKLRGEAVNVDPQ